MSRYLYGESVAAFEKKRSFSWRRIFVGAFASVRIWRKRAHDRQQLLDYLAKDHRAAKDLGIDFMTAREWAERPFWKP